MSGHSRMAIAERSPFQTELLMNNHMILLDIRRNGLAAQDDVSESQRQPASIGCLSICEQHNAHRCPDTSQVSGSEQLDPPPYGCIVLLSESFLPRPPLPVLDGMC